MKMLSTAGGRVLSKRTRDIMSLLAIGLLLLVNCCKGFNSVANSALKPSIRFFPGTPFSPVSTNGCGYQRDCLPVMKMSEDATENSDDKKEKGGILAKIKGAFGSKPSDGLTMKERLAKMGLSCLLSYGFVSNMSYCVAVSLAWFGFTKKTGLSPLAPGQWKPFLAVYAGFYVFNNIVRPIRFGLSVGVARYFDKVIAFVQRKAKVSKGVAVGLVVFLANFCGTLGGMALGISIASALSGVPVFPPKI